MRQLNTIESLTSGRRGRLMDSSVERGLRLYMTRVERRFSEQENKARSSASRLFLSR